MFPDGWGETDQLDHLTTWNHDEFEHRDIDVIWSRKEEHRGARVRRGTFRSPVSEILPADSRVAAIEWWSPPAGDERVAIILPAWNEEGFATRRVLAGLLARVGVSSVLLEGPLYGSRRASASHAQPIRTIADFLLLGYGTVVEALALVSLAAEQGTPGITGYSMGGSVAAFTSAVSSVPVATAPLAASHSPGPVIFEGMIRNGVSWKRFAPEESDRLRSILERASVTRVAPRPHHPAAVLVSATADGFVPPAASAAIASHWNAEIRWVEAGHGTLLARHKPKLVSAVADSFDRVESLELG